METRLNTPIVDRVGFPVAADDGTALLSKQVVLVDRYDRQTGVADKYDVHIDPGKLHRAFSVIIQDRSGRILLQKRANSKYHFGGRWTNTCCSHPEPDEDLIEAAHRRVKDEMGMYPEVLTRVGMFEYRAHDPISGLVEHELDHVIVGRCDGPPFLNRLEASDFAWLSVAELMEFLQEEPEQFTPWLKPALNVFIGSGMR
jgi:isopentenyl-diphosphate Delta-isomerase